MRRASDTTAMQPRRPYEYPIELRENSFPHPRVKSFLLVISIGSIAGCGYFLAHSPTFRQMFEPEFVPPIAATLPQLPKKSGQNPDTKFQNVKSPDFSTPIAPSGAMTAAAAAVPSLHSVSRSADFSTPPAVRDTSAAVSYTSPDLAPAAHPVSYVAPPQGQVLGASTENASPQNFATVQQLADLQNQIDALKNLPRSVFVPSFSGPAASTPVSTATFALSQKIDQLSGTSLSNVTVNGVSGLTDADIPDSITASNYLPLTGGTLTGGSILQSISSNPTLVGSTTDTALTQAAVVRISGNYAYTVGGSRFTVIDISKPTSPTVVASINDSTKFNIPDIGGLRIAGNYAYVGSKSLFTIVDISNPASPQVASSLSSSLFSSIDSLTVYISGRYAYVGAARATQKLIVIDIANPLSPSIVGSINFDSPINGNTFSSSMYVQGKYAYIGFWTSPALLKIYDISVPSTPALVSTSILPTSFGDGPTDIVVDGKYAYIGGDYNTLWVADVSNPSDPSVNTYNNSIPLGSHGCGRSIYKAGNYLYAVSLFTNPAVCVYDVSDPAAGPSLVGYTPSPFGSTVVTDGLASIALSGRYLYTLASYQNYFLAYDVTGADLPNARIGDLQSTNLHISGNADFYNNLYVQGGLNVGLGGILSNGPLAASSLFANTTLGIGTSTPWGKFAISLNSGETNTNAFIIASSTASATTTLLVVTNAGNVGIGTTSPWAKFSVAGAAGGTTPLFTISSTTSGFATSTAFIVDKNGLTGIASSSPWRTFSVTGTVGFDGLTPGAGAGALCLSANKEVTYSNGAGCTGSSQRFKHDIVSLHASTSLASVLKLNPVSFVYNDDIGVKGPQVGLIAEEVQQVDPRLVATDPSGVPFTVKYENLTAILAAAIQNIFAQISDLADTVASFADHFTTRELAFTRASGQELCLSDAPNDPSPVCITKPQLAALLSQSAAAGFANPTPAATPSNLANPTPDPDPASGTSDGTPSAQTTPPVIQINGENPAQIQVGDTYNDLGATITGPQADLNLGIKTFLNGALVSNIVLDTSTTTTATIDYVATDQNGLTSTSTRTVIIELPTVEAPQLPAKETAADQPSPPPPASSSLF